MKEYEKLAEEFAKPTEGETAGPMVVMAAKLGFEGGFLKAREMILPILRLARVRLHDIDVALSEGRPELAQEVWKHAYEELNRAIIFPIGEQKV